MIGAHNTLTSYPAKSWLMNKCKRWWKCQNLSVKDLYEAGVRFFDFRLCWDDNKWCGCHGTAKLKVTYLSLEALCREMRRHYPKAIYRIVLESGGEAHFLEEAQSLCARHPMLWRIDIKSRGDYMGSVANNNENLYNKGYLFAKVATWELPAHEITGHITTSTVLSESLKSQAGFNNRMLPFYGDKKALKAMLNSKDELYLIDYCDIVIN